MGNIMAALRIIGLSILAAVLFGVVHDQVTARICVEYFTIGHPKILATESPTVLGLVWGVIATWWVGLLLGVPLAIASIRGSAPGRTAVTLVRPIAILLACMAAASALFGFVGYGLASNGVLVLMEPLASRVPEGRHIAFLAVGWAHGASYLAGFVGGIVLIWRVRGARKGK